MDSATRPAASYRDPVAVPVEAPGRHLPPRLLHPAPPLDREALLDLLPIGVLVVDGELRLRLANAVALGVLAHHDPLRVEEGRLCCAPAEQLARLQRLVDDGRLAPSEPGRIVLASQDGERRIVVTARLMEKAECPAGNVLCLALAEERAPSSTMVCGLSRRRREILGRLLSGSRPEAIARDLGLSEHTVRAYVKDLYRHFGTHSRGELLARFIPPPE